jgi:hypothetical protein
VALRLGTFEILQPLVWLVDDRTLEVQMTAVELLARCVETGANSGFAIKVHEPEKPPPDTRGENTNDYITITPLLDGPGGLEEEEAAAAPEEKVDWKEGYEVAILRLLQLMTDRNITMRHQVAQAMRAVTAAGDKRVTKMIRQHLQSKDPDLAETTLNALSGALVKLDVHKECYLPSRDELEHDDLEVKDAAVKQRNKAKDTIDFLKRMHKLTSSSSPSTRKTALLAIGPLLLYKWPDTLSAFLEALGDASEEIQTLVVKRLRSLKGELPDEFIPVLLQVRSRLHLVEKREGEY